MWMELNHVGGRDSALMAGRWRGVGGAVVARRRGLAGGSAESDVLFGAESRNYRRRPSLRAGNGDACGT
uniref:Uncharacterized protein n=1 Tax=Oryza punctata TaxID=4537 RepID=A0A0E0LM52_ORYPU